MNKDEALRMALDSKHGQVCIGVKDGMGVYVSVAALAQYGLGEIKEKLSMTKRWPVKTDISGNVVMVEGATHEDAVNRYLNRSER